MSSNSIVNLSELERERIDAEFYSPQYLETLDVIKKGTYQTIGSICDVTSGSTPPDREEGLTEGIILLKTVNIQQGFINFENDPFYINEILDERLSSTRLQPYDILLNIVGATLEVIGRVAIIPPDFPRANITQAMALIRIKDEAKSDYYPEYIFAFLLSKYGQHQVARLSRQSGQYNLNHDELRSIIIPKIPMTEQRIFREMVSKFWEEWKTSINQYDKATLLLLSNLELIDWEPKEPLSYKRDYTKLNSIRIDAEYYQPKYDELLDKIARFEPVSLITQTKPIVDTIRPEPEKSYCYIEISDVDISLGEVNFTERKGEELPPNARIPVKGGELIVSKVRPTRGAIGIVPIRCSRNGVCSKAFSVFDVESPMREFLQVVLRSIVGKLQLERPTKGTSYPTIKDKDVFNIKIPIINETILNEISKLVKNSFINRYNAKEKLTEVKRKINLTIESD